LTCSDIGLNGATPVVESNCVIESGRIYLDSFSITYQSYPDLVFDASHFYFANNANLQLVKADKLTYIGSNFALDTNNVLTLVSVPELVYGGTNMQIQNHPLLTFINAPKVTYVSTSLYVQSNAVLTFVDLSSLQYAGGNGGNVVFRWNAASFVVPTTAVPAGHLGGGQCLIGQGNNNDPNGWHSC